MERITQKDLEYLTDRINEATGSPKANYTLNNQSYIGNIGNYHPCYAYGGVKLVRICNVHGGIDNISRGGFGTKRELYNWMTAFLAGMAQKN